MNHTRRMFQVVGALGILAVILGAFGAHSLSDVLSDRQISSYKTGVQYHFYHLLALLATAILYTSYPVAWLRRSFSMFFIGIILFSGSIYILSCRELIGLVHYKWLGPLTPIGGVFFICGWVSLFASSRHLNSIK